MGNVKRKMSCLFAPPISSRKRKLAQVSGMRHDEERHKRGVREFVLELIALEGALAEYEEAIECEHDDLVAELFLARQVGHHGCLHVLAKQRLLVGGAIRLERLRDDFCRNARLDGVALGRKIQSYSWICRATSLRERR